MHFLIVLLQRVMGMRHPGDGGPVYFETDMDRLVQEPWNGISAALFLLIVWYWIMVLRGRWSKHRFMTIATPILAVGGIGGTIYHLFRAHPIWLYMDWVPIAILTLSAAIVFLYRVTGAVWKTVLAFLALFLFQYFTMDWIAANHPEWAAVATNVNYGIMGLVVLIPALLLIRRYQGRGGRELALSLGMFALAITFRSADGLGWLPMGTHFLWHTFGALACHFIFSFVFRMDNLRHVSLSDSGIPGVFKSPLPNKG